VCASSQDPLRSLARRGNEAGSGSHSTRAGVNALQTERPLSLRATLVRLLRLISGRPGYMPCGPPTGQGPGRGGPIHASRRYVAGHGAPSFQGSPAVLIALGQDRSPMTRAVLSRRRASRSVRCRPAARETQVLRMAGTGCSRRTLNTREPRKPPSPSRVPHVLDGPLTHKQLDEVRIEREVLQEGAVVVRKARSRPRTASGPCGPALAPAQE
jgi:hypothetical protein